MTSTAKHDAEERHVLLTKLFHVYPSQGELTSIALRIGAYHEELADIHVAVLRPALRRLWRDHRRGAFLPSIAEIRRSAAFVIRACRGGRAPDAPETSEAPDINVERYIEVGPRPGEPCTWPQLTSGAPRQLAAGAP